MKREGDGLMGYISRGDDISVLHLSVRSQNCLRRCNLDTVGCLLDYPLDELIHIRNMGVKSLNEIRKCVAAINDQSGEYLLVDRNSENATIDTISMESVVIPTDNLDAIDDDLPISELPLSVRSKNCLKRNGYTSASQLLSLTRADLLSMQNMGQKSVEEVLSFLSEDSLLRPAKTEETTEFSDILAKELSDFYGDSVRIWQRELSLIHDAHPNAIGETFIYILYESDRLRSTAKSSILEIIEKNNGSISKASLSASIPEHLVNTTILEELLLELEKAGAVEVGDERVRRLYPSIVAFVAEIQDERQRKIIQMRLGNSTLEEIGQKYGLTRERIRQVTMNVLKKRPRLREDRYQYIYDTYEFSEDDFNLAFEEPLETYRYLKMISDNMHKYRLPMADILTDSAIAPELRKAAERAVYKDSITVDGLRILKRRPELVKYCVKSRCSNKTKYADFLLLYEEMLNELGLSDDTSLSLDSRTYENILNRSNYVLWNQWRSFRYYDIHSRDYTELLDTLNLTQYENIELSSLKFIHDYPELMEQYDIRDEYELHNLLKKIWRSTDDTSVTFQKMPTIFVGTPNHADQVLSMLIQFAPVSAEDLARRYEEAYGVKATTVMANYLREFDEYYYNGMYRIDQQNLLTSQFEYMKKALCRSFYLISDVKRMYNLAFPKDNPGNINSYTLKTLGFRVFTDYIVKNTYASASEYFRSLLLSDDVVDARLFDRGVTSVVAYSSELYDLRGKYQIVEFSPLQYINIRRLNQNGIGIDDFYAYQQSVAKFSRIGEFFTICSLRQDGFTHPLDELGFDEWFYSSILLEDRANFTFQRIGGTRLFRLGTQKASLGELLVWLIAQPKKLDIFDLTELLNNRYGIRLSKDKVLEIASSADLYYDRIMETVYIDYDTYFEEI